MRGIPAATVVIGLGLWLAAGCQASKPAPPAPPAHATGSDAATTPAAEPAHVTLPRSPDTPPPRTTRPLDRAELARLSALEFPGFRREDHGTTDRAAEIRHTTVTRPMLGVTVTIEPCDRTPGARRACTAMELDLWQARRDELARSLPPELVGRPDTRLELGVRELRGTTAIYTYQLGAFFGTDAHGQPVGTYRDVYTLYYNDGVNQVRVSAAYIDDAVGGTGALLAIAPPEDLARLAVAFLGFYLHAWR
jgi:hypothetical protein